jgi:hypothetical protein
MAMKQFVGTWKLISSEFKSSDGQVTNPLGNDAIGILMYDASQHMSVQIMRRDRPIFASDDQLNGTPSEMKSAFKGFTAYFGSYDVNEKEAIVTHHVEGSLFPNWIGKDQVRFFEFSDNRLILSTPQIPMGGQQITGQLVWEKVG